MPGQLAHSPADIMRYVLIALGQGIEPLVAGGGVWPVYADNEPDKPDNVITIYNSVNRDSGRVMYSGERQEHHGIQLRVRGSTSPIGYAKARSLAVVLDEGIYQQSVTLGGLAYLVHSVSRTSDVLALGKETPETRRWLFTVNAVVSVRQL